MKTGMNSRNRQDGAVAVMVGISIVLLVGFLALVIDLARVYLARTGLQNAADAAALSGAKQLDGTAAQICCGLDSAVAWAIRTGSGPGPDGKPNNLFFGSALFQTQVNIGSAATTNQNIHFSSSPDGPWVDISTAQSNPADKFFIKVDAGVVTGGAVKEAIAPLFAGVWNIFNMGAFGSAVAGPLVVDVTPVGICQLPDDKTNTNPNYIHDPAATAANNFLSPPPPHVPPAGYEFGYERGVAYRVSDANPLSAGTPFWINPVEMSPTPCVNSHGSNPVTLPYICAGKVNFTPSAGSIVYTNTGVTDPQLEALDSRFDVFNNTNKCDPVSSPPDANIKEYRYNNATTAGSPRAWMNPDPTRQSIRFTSIGGITQPVPWASRTFGPPNNDYGVLWAGGRPLVAAGDATDAAVSARWGNIPTTQGLYHAPTNAATLYPQPSPYAQGSGSFFQAPSNAGKANRRILNVIIVDCKAGPGVCAPATVMGIGRFFMQKKANNPGDKEIYGEFIGMLPASLIKKQFVLYH